MDRGGEIELGATANGDTCKIFRQDWSLLHRDIDPDHNTVTLICIGEGAAEAKVILLYFLIPRAPEPAPVVKAYPSNFLDLAAGKYICEYIWRRTYGRDMEITSAIVRL